MLHTAGLSAVRSKRQWEQRLGQLLAAAAGGGGGLRGPLRCVAARSLDALAVAVRLARVSVAVLLVRRLHARSRSLGAHVATEAIQNLQYTSNFM